MPLINLDTNETPAKKQYLGRGRIVVEAGKDFEIAHWEPGKFIDLSATCPVGKKWKVNIAITIDEEDA